MQNLNMNTEVINLQLPAVETFHVHCVLMAHNYKLVESTGSTQAYKYCTFFFCLCGHTFAQLSPESQHE